MELVADVVGVWRSGIMVDFGSTKFDSTEGAPWLEIPVFCNYTKKRRVRIV